MSEKLPRSNPRLDNFEAQQAQAEQAKFEDELYGDAGTSDFSEEARRRVEEADAYERHMEQLANETRSDFDRGLDRESDAYGREWENADAENEAFDNRLSDAEARKLAESEAFAAKIAADPTLKFADKISQELHEFGQKSIHVRQLNKQRIADLNARLDDLTDRYLESDGYDPDIAAYLIDRDDMTARQQAGEKALADLEAKADKKDVVDTNADRDEVPVVPKFEKPTTSPEDDDIDADLDDDLDNIPPVNPSEKKADSSDDDDDLDSLPPIPTSGAGKEDSDDDIDVALDSMPPVAPSEKTGEDESKKDEERLPADDDTSEMPPVKAEKKSRRERARDAVALAYATLYARYTLGKKDTLERYRGNKKATIIAVGAVALTGAVIAIWAGMDHSDSAQQVTTLDLANGDKELLPGHDTTPLMREGAGIPGMEYSNAATTVTPGEGWYQTMAEAGITNSNTQAEILRNDGVMQQLADMGLAYRAPDLGGWGMNMPANGRIPKEALDILANASK